MPGFLKDARFWGGVVVGYLLCVFVPSLNMKGKLGGKSGG